MNNSVGAAVLNYSGLLVFDTIGREFTARLLVDFGKLVVSVDDSGAQYPLTIDPIFENVQLRRDDPQGVKNSLFGTSVAISGDIIVVGAPDYEGRSFGIAYVFEKSGAAWSDVVQTEIKHYCCRGTEGYNASQGVVYVFDKPASGWTTMTENARLTASDGVPGDGMGWNVGLSGDTVIAGAHSNKNNIGAAYVFVRPGSTWEAMTETDKLLASDGGDGDSFGMVVAICEQTVLVVSPKKTISDEEVGALYLYNYVKANRVFPWGMFLPAINGSDH